MRAIGDDFIRQRLARGTLKVDPGSGRVFVRHKRGRWRELEGWIDPDGYLRSGLGLDGSYRLVALHRVVLIAAGIPIPAGMEPDHINRNPADNRLENLRVVTRAMTPTTASWPTSAGSRTRRPS